MSVTKEKGESVSILGRTAATEYAGKQGMPGAQQPQAYGNGEIVTQPPLGVQSCSHLRHWDQI